LIDIRLQESVLEGSAEHRARTRQVLRDCQEELSGTGCRDWLKGLLWCRRVRYEAGQECRKTLSSRAKLNLPNVAGAKVYSQQ